MVVKLIMGFGSNPRVQPLRDGTVKPDSIELEFVPSRNLFYHNLAIDDLDCSEMSISETILARERTDGTKWDWTVAPIFMSRAHGWNDLCVRADSDINSLADLKGKRVATPDYDMTAALWLRCLLKDLYGIDASDIDWHNIRPRGESHGIELGLDKQPPVGVNVTWHPEGLNAGAALESGEVDAVRGLPASQEVGNSKIRRLLPDGGKAVISEHYQKTGFHHTNHHVIIQNRIVRGASLGAHGALQGIPKVQRDSLPAGPAAGIVLPVLPERRVPGAGGGVRRRPVPVRHQEYAANAGPVVPGVIGAGTDHQAHHGRGRLPSDDPGYLGPNPGFGREIEQPGPRISQFRELR